MTKTFTFGIDNNGFVNYMYIKIMEVKLKDTYYVTHSWMFKLGLKGLEREIFSIIYGFSQGNAGSFHSSLDYLANLTGYHRDSCCRALNSLHKKNTYIKKSISKVHSNTVYIK